ncbi:MAG TPA: hypothetical protein VGF59_10920 [Bryobacteraceae bacterium]|jgi:hypothetical protein
MKIAVLNHGWGVAEALAMKGWLETRWRLIGLIGGPPILLAIKYSARDDPRTAGAVLLLMWLSLSCAMPLMAGSGVKSQAPTHISFPEGLAGSTQFTIALPISRKLLVFVRAGIGLFEAFVATVIVAVAVWELFPSVSRSIAPSDFVRLALTTLLWLPLPYCAALLFQAFLAEPLNFFPAGYGLTFLLWLLHKISPAVDVIRAFGAESPLLTHRLPLTQLATAELLAVSLLLAAVWAVQRREY